MQKIISIKTDQLGCQYKATPYSGDKRALCVHAFQEHIYRGLFLLSKNDYFKQQSNWSER